MKDIIESLKEIFTISELAEVVKASRQGIYNLISSESDSTLANSKVAGRIKILWEYFQKLKEGEYSKEAIYDLIYKDLQIAGIRVEPKDSMIENIRESLNALPEDFGEKTTPQKERWFVVAKMESEDKDAVLLLKSASQMLSNADIIEFDIPQYESYMLQGKGTTPDKLILIGGTEANKFTKLMIDFCPDIEKFENINGELRKSKNGKIIIVNGAMGSDTFELTKKLVQKNIDGM